MKSWRIDASIVCFAMVVLAAIPVTTLRSKTYAIGYELGRLKETERELRQRNIELQSTLASVQRSVRDKHTAVARGAPSALGGGAAAGGAFASGAGGHGPGGAHAGSGSGAAGKSTEGRLQLPTAAGVIRANRMGGGATAESRAEAMAQHQKSNKK